MLRIATSFGILYLLKNSSLALLNLQNIYMKVKINDRCISGFVAPTFRAYFVGASFQGKQNITTVFT